MKRKVSMSELRNYCNESRFTEITYNSKNQKWYKPTNTLFFDLRFSKIVVSENPNLVCLRNKQNVLQLSGVHAAEIDTESSVLGTSIALICGGVLQDEPEITYILFAN